LNRVEPGYLQTLRIPLESGRDFSDRDMPNTPVVAIVNHSLARRFWPGPVREAIGKRFHFFGETATYEVVGVVRDSAYQELSEPPRAMVYLSLRQSYAPAVTLYARASGDPARCLGDLRRQVQSLDPDLLLVDVMTVPQALDRSLWAPQLGAALLSIFGALALLLASVGLYGVISYSVSQRVQEIGIRMALGARPADVLRQVMGEGMSMVGWGIGAGLLAAFAGARVMTRLLFGISPADVTTYLVVVALLGIVAAAACYIPARRATRIDPVLALRAE
ncbi:MAG TPA: FtsX-like permease family protein, partial [Bryobacteraceae bacterium]|nr:FtsX-like permease family protein [Bryobacteraceae bacterium]